MRKLFSNNHSTEKHCKFRSSDFEEELNVTRRFLRLLSGDSPCSIRISQALVFLGALLLALCFSAEAQQAKKIPRLGYLYGADRSSDAAHADALRRALGDLGYTDGQNIAIEARYANGKVERFPELLADLIRLKVDLILARGAVQMLRAVTQATQSIPVVMVEFSVDPVAAGFIESLAHPGGNVTGFTNLSTELSGKRLELLKEAVPKMARVAAFYDPTSRTDTIEIKEKLPKVARAIGLTLRPWEVANTESFEKVFAAIDKDRPDGLYAPPGRLVRANGKRIAGFALRSKLPSAYDDREGPEAGGLMYYGADLADSYRRVAYYVDRIFKGAKPADLPVEQPKKFEFVVNLKTAKQIGLTIPPDVLSRANRVIK